MKFNFFVFSVLCFIGSENLKAQEIRSLSIEETIHLAIENSNDAKISSSEVLIAENKLRASKNRMYPDVNISGQYKYLTTPGIDLAPGFLGAEKDNSSPAMPDIHQLMLGQASISVPLFAGFKIKNTIEAASHNFEAETYSHHFDQEKIGLYAVKNYIQLYKAEQTVKLVKENLKSAARRVTDFSAMEKNGLLAKNDLLKAKLQKSTVELALEEAKKNRYILNFRLVTFLKLPTGTRINAQKPELVILPKTTILSDSLSRGDIHAAHYRILAAKDAVEVAKGGYFPSISLSAGYIAADLHNALTIKNAMNIGVGISYDLSSIFKNKREVKLAESKVQKLKFTASKISDLAKVEIENAQKEYQLALKKFAVYTKSKEQAIENYRIVKDKYDNGLQDTNDLLEADVQQLRAKMELAYASADIVLKYYALEKAKGTLVSQLNKK